MKSKEVWLCSKCHLEKPVERGSVFRNYPKGLSCPECGTEMKIERGEEDRSLEGWTKIILGDRYGKEKKDGKSRKSNQKN